MRDIPTNLRFYLLKKKRAASWDWRGKRKMTNPTTTSSSPPPPPPPLPLLLLLHLHHLPSPSQLLELTWKTTKRQRNTKKLQILPPTPPWLLKLTCKKTKEQGGCCGCVKHLIKCRLRKFIWRICLPSDFAQVKSSSQIKRSVQAQCIQQKSPDHAECSNDVPKY